ncbi:MAG: carbohydrate ABC transporter substrate-binding protein, partial [Oscillospiraceae bacterium]|nr:carbohydrate ABC transporter substrate-binding protein [Oscillospiraceae bacterium]
MIKKTAAIIAAAVMILCAFTACNGNPTNTVNPSDGNNANETVKVIRYLNFKPEIAEVYDKIAKEYENETGVKLIVETAASG